MSTPQDGYGSWVERVMGGREGRPLTPGEAVTSSSGEPFGAVCFVKVPRKSYLAEVGKRGDLYIYHFYFPNQSFPTDFEDKLGDAFIEVFKRPEQIEAGYVDDLKSWAVRVRGFGTNVWGDDLAVRVFDVLDSLLEK